MKLNLIFGRIALLFLALIMTLGLLVGCSPLAPSSVSVWIDVPRDRLALSDIQAINIDGHAASSEGIRRIEVWINGVLLTAFDNPPSVDELASFHIDWTPDTLGEYTIQALAFSPDGTSSEPDSARVVFGEIADDVQPQCTAEVLVAPLLVSPADGAAVETNLVLTWSYPDSACHPYSYMIDISEDASFADISWGFGTLDNLETSRSWPLPAGQCYFWRARAYVPDETGPASSAWQFCIAEEEATDNRHANPAPCP